MGIEPPVLDDVASGRFLFPKFIPLTAFVVGATVEVLLLWSILSRSRPRPWRAVIGALASSYGAAAVLAVLASLVLRSSILNKVSVQAVFIGVSVGLTVGAFALAALLLSLLRSRLGLDAVPGTRLVRISATENLVSLAVACGTWAVLLLARYRWHG